MNKADPLEAYKQAAQLLGSIEKFMGELPSSNLLLREVFARDRVLSKARKLLDTLKGPALAKCMTLVGEEFTDSHGYNFLVTSINKDQKVSLDFGHERLSISLQSFLNTIIHLNGYSPLSDYENYRDRMEDEERKYQEF